MAEEILINPEQITNPLIRAFMQYFNAGNIEYQARAKITDFWGTCQFLVVPMLKTVLAEDWSSDGIILNPNECEWELRRFAPVNGEATDAFITRIVASRLEELDNLKNLWRITPPGCSSLYVHSADSDRMRVYANLGKLERWVDGKWQEVESVPRPSTKN